MKGKKSRMMLSKVLPIEIFSCISHVIKDIYEIRLRVDEPLVVNRLNNYVYYGKRGITTRENAIKVSKEMLDNILLSACNHSVYAFSEQIKKGYINLGEGIRMGVCGEVVMNGERIASIKDLVGLNIRVPHSIEGVSRRVMKYLDPPKSLLVVSPCGAGKTTFLRDLVCQFGKKEKITNIMVVDERGEIAGINKGRSLFCLPNTDVLTNCDKKTAVINSLRVMNPDIIVTDELFYEDLPYINTCANGGVKVFASIHASSLEELSNRIPLIQLNKIFELYVVLSKKTGVGKIEGVFDNKQKQLE